MQDTTPQVCSAIKRDGTPCKAIAAFDSDTCFMHSDRAKSAQISGGKSKAKPIPTEKPDLSTPESCRQFIEETIYRVQNGLLPLSIGRFSVYAVSVVRALQDDDIMARIESLEAENGR